MNPPVEDVAAIVFNASETDVLDATARARLYLFSHGTLADAAAVDATDSRGFVLTAADYAIVTALLRDILDDVMESTAQEASILEIANKLQQLRTALSKAQPKTTQHPMLLITNLCEKMPCTVTRMRSHQLPEECSVLFRAACEAKRVGMEQFALLNVPIFDFRAWDDLLALPRRDRNVEWSVQHTPSSRDLGGQLFTMVLNWTVDKLALLHPPACDLDGMGLPTRNVHDDEIDVGGAHSHNRFTYSSYAAALIKFNGILCGILDRRVEPDTFLCEIPYGVYATGDRNEEHIIFVNHLQYAFYKDESDYVDRLIEEMEPEMAQRLKEFDQANEINRWTFKQFIRFKCWSTRPDIRLLYFHNLYERSCESFELVGGSLDRHVVSLAEQQEAPKFNIILKDDDDFSMLRDLFLLVLQRYNRLRRSADRANGARDGTTTQGV